MRDWQANVAGVLDKLADADWTDADIVQSICEFIKACHAVGREHGKMLAFSGVRLFALLAIHLLETLVISDLTVHITGHDDVVQSWR